MILCIGATPTAQRTLSFDRLAIDEVNRAAQVDEYASGKSINVARVAHLIGADVCVSGFVGGVRGQFLCRELDRDGIRHDFTTVPLQTRLCTTVIDRAKHTVTELVEESSPVEADRWEALRRKIARLMRKSRACVMSGSLPPGGPMDFYASCIEQANAVDCPVILDTAGQPLRLALKHEQFTVKLNREELASTVGRKLQNDKALQSAMREVEPKDGSVFVTMGREGAIAWDGRSYWRIAAPRVATVNPIGSGDAFAAGLAVAAIRGLATPENYALASACGAANAMTERAGVVDPLVVKKLCRTVKVTRLSG